MELQPFVFLEEVIKLTIRVERQLKCDSQYAGDKISSFTTTSSKSVLSWDTKSVKKKGIWAND